MPPATFVPRGSALIGMAFLLLAVPALALDNPGSRASLKGLKAVDVVVEEVRPDAEKDGLTASQLQTDVELRLRQAGIEVVPSSPEFLSIIVGTDKSNETGLYAFSILVAFGQPVMLLRDSKIVIYDATTWSVSRISTVGAAHLRDVRGTVADLVDKFINAYLEQNPKQ